MSKAGLTDYIFERIAAAMGNDIFMTSAVPPDS
jgi:hypothetical protein